MSDPSDQEKLEEIYRVLSDLRYLMHQESNELQDFQRIARDYYGRIATAAKYASAMLPSDVVAKHHDP
ncbi:hypothetical protein GCM10007385_17520 [Tateyamaria omphalii]|uniref:hypothetical protein n=1 Tax=Tateyamaria omphalii TaxID=299262 RepID=UPI0019C4923C|nr:hypothetical protein [Tateyamaria omphalii]GGX49748.1 hypothetical protein GCM10007385_17520 [Tateyamaria omphalii]